MYLITPSSQKMIVSWVVLIQFNGLFNMVLIIRKVHQNHFKFNFNFEQSKPVYNLYNLIFNSSLEVSIVLLLDRMFALCCVGCVHQCLLHYFDSITLIDLTYYQLSNACQSIDLYLVFETKQDLILHTFITCYAP